MPGDSAPPGPEELTALLRRASAGEQEAAAEILSRIGRELHQLASRHMRRERENHTLQTTAVINEAYLRMFGNASGSKWTDRTHFFAVASRVIRQILVDYARAKQTDKRHGVVVSVEVAEAAAIGPISVHVLDVHLALEEFEKIAPRQAKLVEMRFFSGLSLGEAAEVIGISPRMADKDWALARAWLRRRLGSKE
jgi:RNA polymerase sigma-70 factor (ECF subfamily)